MSASSIDVLVGVPWGQLVPVAFSDGGVGSRASSHSQSGGIVVLAHPCVAEGHSAKANILDYVSTKVTLTCGSSYDVELHSLYTVALVVENLQATLSERGNHQAVIPIGPLLRSSICVRKTACSPSW